MSIIHVLKDLASGDFSDAARRLREWWSGLLPEIQNEIHILASDEGKILQDLAKTAVQDIVAGGLTTASFVAAAKDIEEKLVAQNIALGRQTIFTALNAIVSQSLVSIAPAQATE